jgi:hypothetical protein
MPSVRQSRATDGGLNRADLIGFRQKEKSKTTITRNPFLLVMGESMIKVRSPIYPSQEFHPILSKRQALGKFANNG